MEGLTRKDLSDRADVPYYLVDYLSRLGKLPILTKSKGRGFPTIYSPEAVEILRSYVKARTAVKNVGASLGRRPF